MKVFEITWNTGSIEWVAAPSLLGAIKFYCSETVFDISDIEDDDEIREVPESEWKNMKIANTEYDPEDPNDKEYFTVDELMKEAPCLLCGNMYE